MRDRLIELLNADMSGCEGDYAEEMADYLLANGVIVPHVKIGEAVYIVTKSKNIVETKVIGVWQCEKSNSIITENGSIHQNSWGKTVFLTKEEAEQALKGGAE